VTDSLVLAFVIGVAFGFTLERAGLADAPKLARQFYLTDLTVFKVMFTALVTAMLGLFWLGRFGVVDVSAIYVPERSWVRSFSADLCSVWASWRAVCARAPRVYPPRPDAWMASP
jgi:hypothetical protein